MFHKTLSRGLLCTEPYVVAGGSYGIVFYTHLNKYNWYDWVKQMFLLFFGDLDFVDILI
jgi:hypothetical protein